MTVMLDTHALYWWATEPNRLGPVAAGLLAGADELAVAAITWWELAWLVRQGRIGAAVPVRSLITSLAREVRTVALSPAIAIAAAELPDTFPRDPGVRLIYATAVEHGWRLVTKDGRLRSHDQGGTVTVW